MAQSPDRIRVTNDALAKEIEDAGKRLIEMSMALRSGFEVDVRYVASNALESTDARKLIAEARARADYIKRLPVEKYSSSSRIMHELADALEALNRENEGLTAKLEMPCGSCHPCTNWANQTWINAGLNLPTLIRWVDVVDERDALRRENEELRGRGNG